MDGFRQTTRRIYAMIRRGVLQSWTEAKNPRVIVVGAQGKKRVEMMQSYGMAYWPPSGSEVVHFACQGDEDLAYAVGATGGTSRPTPSYPGHVIVYGTKGQRIDFMEDGSINITASKITLNGIDWDAHKHIGVEPGGGTSGGPV